MNTVIGPRIVFYQNEDDDTKSIEITVEIGDRQTVELPGGDRIEEHVAVVRLKSDWFDRTMTFSGADDLQAIYRCLWLSDVWLQKVCKDAQVNLFTIVADQPATKAFDVFS